MSEFSQFGPIWASHWSIVAQFGWSSTNIGKLWPGSSEYLLELVKDGSSAGTAFAFGRVAAFFCSRPSWKASSRTRGHISPPAANANCRALLPYGGCSATPRAVPAPCRRNSCQVRHDLGGYQHVGRGRCTDAGGRVFAGWSGAAVAVATCKALRASARRPARCVGMRPVSGLDHSRQGRPDNPYSSRCASTGETQPCVRFRLHTFDILGYELLAIMKFLGR